MTFVPYQVDYSVKNTAKTLGFSKKRVSFRFGFASGQALDQGLTSAQCRGSEHEVVFLWSLKSGKRQLYLDGKDVHYSESGMNGWTVDRAWQHSFPLREPSTNRTFKVHFISQPINKDIPDSKAFDLRINGVSYFSFNEIWKLGTPAMTTREGPRGYQGHQSGRDSPISAEERRQIALAKVESLRELEQQKAKEQQKQQESQKSPMQREEQALISFDDPPPPVVSTGHPGGAGVPPNNYQQRTSSLTLESGLDGRAYSSGSHASYGQNPPPPNPYGMPPPVPEYSPYGAPPPGDSTAMTTYTAGSGGSSAYSHPPPPIQTYGYGQPGAPPAAAGFNSLTSPGAQSYASYGSAPSFARPPPSPAAPSNPYAAPPPSSNPYGAPPPPSNPYGAPAPSSNPYGAPAPSNNPYGAPPPPSNNPYGGPGGYPQQQYPPSQYSQQSYGY